jgi:membrane-associated phospholipid phosphatase
VEESSYRISRSNCGLGRRVMFGLARRESGSRRNYALRRECASFDSLNVHSSGDTVALSGHLSRVAGVVIGVSAFSGILMFLKRRRDRALLVVVTMSGAEVLLSILKRHFHRQRPEPFFDTRLPPSYSFPSGHALLSFCCYGLLAALGSAYLRGRIRWLIRICAAALILAIGVSRIYLSVHYPTDVIAGYLVAIAWTAVVAAIYAHFRYQGNMTSSSRGNR